jgi:hypothetical protein
MWNCKAEPESSLPGSADALVHTRRTADEGVRAPAGVLVFLLLAAACAAQSDSPYGRRIVEARSRTRAPACCPYRAISRSASRQDEAPPCSCPHL